MGKGKSGNSILMYVLYFLFMSAFFAVGLYFISREVEAQSISWKVSAFQGIVFGAIMTAYIGYQHRKTFKRVEQEMQDEAEEDE